MFLRSIVINLSMRIGFRVIYEKINWTAAVQYHPVQCLLLLCNTYQRQPSVRFMERLVICKGCHYNTVSRNSNVMVPLETPIIAQQNASYIVT